MPPRSEPPLRARPTVVPPHESILGFRSPAFPGAPDWPQAKALALELLTDLASFAASDLRIQVRSALWPEEPLWWVPRPEHIPDLQAEGITRGRIWTAAELGRIRTAAETATDPQALVRLAIRAKLYLDAELPP
jgi:hypothetical protein